MNEYGAGGFAAGITEGLKTVQQGMLTAESIHASREKRRQQAQEHTASMQQAATKQSSSELQLEQLQLELKEMKGQLAKRDSFQSLDAYRKTGDAKYLNLARESSPELQKISPDVASFSNLKDYSPEKLQSLGLTQEMIDQNPGRYTVLTTKDNRTMALDMYAAYAKSGYLAYMDDQDIKEITARTARAQGQAGAIGAEKQLADMTAFFEANPNATYAEWQSKVAMSDPKTQIDITKTKAQITEIEAKTKKALAQAQAALANPGNQRRDSLKQLEDAIAMLNDPNTPPEKRDALVSWIDKASTSAGYATQERSLGDLTGERKKALEIVDSSKPDLAQARSIQDQIIADLPATEVTKVKAAEKLAETNYNTASGVDRLLDNHLTGKLKVDADAVANAETWVKKNIGDVNPEVARKVRFDTEAGMLLAGYIKELSGTAASDAEVQRLTNIFLAGSYADEDAIKESMDAFRQSLRAKNKTLLEPYKDTLPHSYLTYTGKGKPKVDLSKYVTGSNSGGIKLDDLWR